MDIIAEVAPAVNASLDQGILAPGGTVAVYATDGGRELTVSVSSLVRPNASYHFVLVYTMPGQRQAERGRRHRRGGRCGRAAGGRRAGLPLTRYPLERTSDAHDAVHRGVVGKVLIDVG